MKSVLPHFHQHVDYAARGVNTLDMAYTIMKDAVRAAPHPHLGSSDFRPDYRTVLSALTGMCSKQLPLLTSQLPHLKNVPFTNLHSICFRFWYLLFLLLLWYFLIYFHILILCWAPEIKFLSLSQYVNSNHLVTMVTCMHVAVCGDFCWSIKCILLCVIWQFIQTCV